MLCPSCGTDNPPGFSFCGHCGTPLPRRCPQCGLESPPGFSFCGHCGADLSRLSPTPVESPLEGERRFVAVLFADIAGFTRLSERLDAEEATALVNRCLERMTEAVSQNGGRVDKYTGDGLMAVFGAPIAHEDDPERALRAALAMQASVSEMRLAPGGGQVPLHIGLACGQVVAARVGGHSRREYTVIGTSVNLAARLEEVSAPGQILVNEELARLTEHEFIYRPVSLPKLHGWDGSVLAFELIGERRGAVTATRPGAMRSPLVGREAEASILWRCLEDLTNRRGGIVSVIGEAGIGKSRLLQEVRGQAHERGLPINWLEGHSLESGEAVRYGCFRSLLQSAIGAATQADVADVAERLRTSLEMLLPDRVGEVYPYLGRVLGVSLDVEAAQRLERLDGESLKWQTFRIFSEWVAAQVEREPLVLVVEEAHWADPTSVELLEHLLPLARRVPLLMVKVYRPEPDRPAWRLREVAGREHREVYTELWLRPLPAVAAERMVAYLLHTDAVPPKALELILGRAEGNPLFIEEIVRSMVDRGVLVEHEEGFWDLSPTWHEFVVPETIQGILQARMDRLGDEARRTLQVAACIGRVFPRRLLAASLAAIEGAERDIDLDLERLLDSGLIEEQSGPPEREYVFRHILVMDAARSGLLRQQRRTIHLHLAQALEAMFAGRLADHYAILAHHYAEANQEEQALDYFLLAGDYARSNYALEDALSFYERALEFLHRRDEAERTAKTLMKMALVNLNRFDFAAASAQYAESFRLWRPGQEAAESPVPDRALRLILPSWPMLDPARVGDAYSVIVLSQIFEGLGIYDTQETNILPAAAGWEIHSNGHRYIFSLRRDGRWSDGTPVTAHDFVFAIRRVLDPRTRSPVAPVLRDIVGAMAFRSGETDDPSRIGVRALDDWSLEVSLERPVCNFPSLFPFRACFPVPAAAVQAWGDDWAQPERMISNGPFRVKQCERDVSLWLERNPYYTGPSRGNVGQVECCIVRDDEQMLALYDADQVDVVEAYFGDVDQLRERYGAQLVITPQLFTRYLGFRCDRPPFDDPRLRHAFVRSVDHAAVDAMNHRLGHVPAGGGFVPPGMPGHSPDIRLQYDPDTARRLMKEAGYAGGRGFPPVRMLIGRRADALAMAELLQRCWQDVLGVTVHTDMLPAEQFFQQLADPPALFILAWTVDFAEPYLFLALPFHSASPSSRIRWRNSRYDRLVEGATSTADPNRRMEMYHRADYLLVAEEAAVLPLSYGQRVMLIKPWVQDFPAASYSVALYKDVVVTR